MEDQYENHLFLDPRTSALFPTMKQCARCPKEKPLSDFNNRQSTKDGKQAYCRLCQEEDRLQRFYHFSRQERALMYDRQQGQCPVCQESHPQLYIYAFQGIGVLKLVCPRCMRILNGFNRNPAIVESAIAYLDYFGSRVLYGVALRFQDDWEARQTREPPRQTHRRPYRRGVNPDTYDHWSFLNEHTCYICWEPCPTGRDLARDHQHITERNRGLLCFSCNTTLGIAKEDPNLLHACATFLESYLVPYIASVLWITDAMIAEAAHDALLAAFLLWTVYFTTTSMSSA